MAEFMMRDLCEKKGVADKVFIESAAIVPKNWAIPFTVALEQF